LKSNLMQKNGIVAMSLAREFLGMSVGDRLETVAAYSEKFQMARGTVQAALELIKTSGAIDVRPRGHLGTFISFIDYKKLWEFTDYGTCLGVMPLPYSKRYEGLATALYQLAEESVIPFSLAYMRGSQSRIDGLLKGRYDFAVMSKYSATAYMKSGMDIEIVTAFGRDTYVGKHALIFANRNKSKLEDGMRIAIDKSSFDIKSLTEAACKGVEVTYVEVPYSQILNKLLSGEVDASVWSTDEIIEKGVNLNYYDLKSVSEDNDTEAVIVVKEGNEGIKNLLAKAIEIERVVAIQGEVLSGDLIPRY